MVAAASAASSRRGSRRPGRNRLVDGRRLPASVAVPSSATWRRGKSHSRTHDRLERESASAVAAKTAMAGTIQRDRFIGTSASPGLDVHAVVTMRKVLKGGVLRSDRENVRERGGRSIWLERTRSQQPTRWSSPCSRVYCEDRKS